MVDQDGDGPGLQRMGGAAPGRWQQNLGGRKLADRSDASIGKRDK